MGSKDAKVIFNRQDIANALCIYMALKGYSTESRYDFNWGRGDLIVTTGIEPLNHILTLESLRNFMSNLEG